jgi:hypothetical protein
MARYSLGLRTSNVTIANATLEIIAGLKPLKLAQMDFTLNAATASVFGLGRPAALGLTPTTPVGLLMDANGDPAAGTALVALAWGTGPTVPASFIKRISLAGEIGAPAVWSFGATDSSGRVGNNGLVIPAGHSLVLWNLSAVSVVDVNLVIDE